ncbi:sulfotransferase family protein [Halomonas sp. LR3S48]|uniref:sulfotransferase family protein n=1 Tax=Halomonas sp. LR3S48 TaxID=2982694 RepID=UPI0021E50D0C|nr:sulfotransferase family protein [Halomonas sp. LR3S48]UYG01955.1 sulfotransferase family protein [Halomonas sp. LR3S48]
MDDLVKIKPWEDVELNTHISLGKSYIYFQVSKTASSTIKYYLQQAELERAPWKKVLNVNDKQVSPHLSPYQLSEEIFNSTINSHKVKKVTFVRNPYSRLLSCYLHRIVGQKNSRSAKWLARYMKRSDISNLSFEEFITVICSQNSFDMESHWRVQYDEALCSYFNFNFIGKQETLKKDVKLMLDLLYEEHERPKAFEDINESPMSTGATNKLREYYTDALMSKVVDRYKNDFHFFGYEEELPSG